MQKYFVACGRFQKVGRTAQILEITLTKLYLFAPYAYAQLLRYKKLLKSWALRFALNFKKSTPGLRILTSNDRIAGNGRVKFTNE